MAQTFNETIEASVLAILFKDGSLYSVVEDILEKKSFGWMPFGIVYQSIERIVRNDGYPDLISVSTDLENRGLLDTVSVMSNGLRGHEALEWLATKEVNKDALETYAYQIQSMDADRHLISLSDNIKRWIESKERLTPIEIVSKIDLETGKIATFVGAKSNSLKNSKDVARTSYEQFEQAVGGKNLYIPTGIDAWDDFTNGLYPGRLYIVSAASNDGKSSLVLNIVHNICVRNGRKVFLLTLESSAEEAHNKLIQIITGIPSLRIEKGEIKESEVDVFKSAYKEVADAPIMYDDSPELILPILRTKIRKSVAEGAELIIIDQLEQLMIGGGGDTQAEFIRLNYIAYRVKAYAREMNVPIILVHQMNRGADSGQNRGKFVDVNLTDLSQAGEKPADAVLMIRHKKERQEILETYFAWVKNRQGKKGLRQVEFIGKQLLFKDLPGKSEYPAPDWAQDAEFEQQKMEGII